VPRIQLVPVADIEQSLACRYSNECRPRPVGGNGEKRRPRAEPGDYDSSRECELKAWLAGGCRERRAPF
jgi:hypothetical protein